MDNLTDILDGGGSIDVSYLDLAKAFDTVPHQRLLIKQSNYAVGGQVMEWIREFLTRKNKKVRMQK